MGATTRDLGPGAPEDGAGGGGSADKISQYLNLKGVMYSSREQPMKLSLSILIFALATIGSEAVNVYYDDKTYNICQGQQAFLHSTGNNGLCAYSHSEWTSGNYLGTNECEGLAPKPISRGNGQDKIHYIRNG